MHSERYVHPEFGFLSPTPRLRRDLRTAFLSLLFGIGIGAAAVFALSGNNNGDDTRGPHGVSSASVTSEEPTETVLGYNSQQAAGMEKRVNKDNTSKPDGNRKIHATTTCEGNNSDCRNVPPPPGKPGGTQVPATVGTTLAITSAPSEAITSAPSEPASEHSTADRSEDRVGDPPQSNPLTHKESSETARNPRPRQQHAPNYREDRRAMSRGYDKPAGEPGRAYSLDRSFGQKGFWDWSR
jgi:hypothetical protein